MPRGTRSTPEDTGHAREAAPQSDAWWLCFNHECKEKADRYLKDVRDLLIHSCRRCFDEHRKLVAESKKEGASPDLVPCHVCFGSNNSDGTYLCDDSFKICKTCKHYQDEICSSAPLDAKDRNPASVSAEKQRKAAWDRFLKSVTDYVPNEGYVISKDVTRSKASVKFISELLTAIAQTTANHTPQKLVVAGSYVCACGEAFPSSQQKANHCKRCKAHLVGQSNGGLKRSSPTDRHSESPLSPTSPKRARKLDGPDDGFSLSSPGKKAGKITNEQIWEELQTLRAQVNALSAVVEARRPSSLPALNS